jgi:hypothetical protein
MRQESKFWIVFFLILVGIPLLVAICPQLRPGQ